eukprot:TRINITY_DN63848_c1_g1_i1.p1 TRINITY_DN63848_c1_g1~~TRINITY_DN63848_c1_g1_i1.p1  ORF type:complete len:437 (+),score=30.29 TRINITY_DN63848_c1_g1_i1:135-1445(+)
MHRSSNFTTKLVREMTSCGHLSKRLFRMNRMLLCQKKTVFSAPAIKERPIENIWPKGWASMPTPVHDPTHIADTEDGTIKTVDNESAEPRITVDTLQQGYRLLKAPCVASFSLFSWLTISEILSSATVDLVTMNVYAGFATFSLLGSAFIKKRLRFVPHTLQPRTFPIDVAEMKAATKETTWLGKTGLLGTRDLPESVLATTPAAELLRNDEAPYTHVDLHMSHGTRRGKLLRIALEEIEEVWWQQDQKKALWRGFRVKGLSEPFLFHIAVGAQFDRIMHSIERMNPDVVVLQVVPELFLTNTVAWRFVPVEGEEDQQPPKPSAPKQTDTEAKPTEKQGENVTPPDSNTTATIQLEIKKVAVPQQEDEEEDPFAAALDPDTDLRKGEVLQKDSAGSEATGKKEKGSGIDWLRNRDVGIGAKLKGKQEPKENNDGKE